MRNRVWGTAENKDIRSLCSRSRMNCMQPGLVRLRIKAPIQSWCWEGNCTAYPKKRSIRTAHGTLRLIHMRLSFSACTPKALHCILKNCLTRHLEVGHDGSRGDCTCGILIAGTLSECGLVSHRSGFGSQHETPAAACLMVLLGSDLNVSMQRG
jgi:hypothetical protein